MKEAIYGFPCCDNPNDFTPDLESCTEKEIVAHAEDCKRWNEGTYERNSGRFCQYFDLKPGESGVVHVSRTPWGIGVSMVDMDNEDGDDE